MKSFHVTFIVLSVGMAYADDCNVVPMVQWAGETSLRNEALLNPVDMVIVQHTVTPEPTTDEDCVHVLKAIRKYQREMLGFDDIGASFLICSTGTVYEGAGWVLVGAHTKGYNTKSIGIAFIGEFGSHLPSSQALSAAQNLISCGVGNNHLTGEYKLVGHRQVTDTVSPGDELQKEVETWPHWTLSIKD